MAHGQRELEAKALAWKRWFRLHDLQAMTLKYGQIPTSYGYNALVEKYLGEIALLVSPHLCQKPEARFM